MLNKYLAYFYSYYNWQEICLKKKLKHFLETEIQVNISKMLLISACCPSFVIISTATYLKQINGRGVNQNYFHKWVHRLYLSP